MTIKEIFKKEDQKFESYLKKYKKITKVAEFLNEKYALKLDHKDVDKLRKRLSRFYNKQGLTENITKLEDTLEFKKASKRKLRKSKYRLSPTSLGYLI